MQSPASAKLAGLLLMMGLGASLAADDGMIGCS